MSNFNSQHNRAVWFDIPVADLDRVAALQHELIKIHALKVIQYLAMIMQ